MRPNLLVPEMAQNGKMPLWRRLREKHVGLWFIFFILVYVIGLVKIATVKDLDSNMLFGAYSLGVSFFILSRFALAYFYAPDERRFDPAYTPSVTFGVPCKNEDEAIYKTIMCIAGSDYPKDRFDIIAVNDGSDDNTLAEMLRAKKDAAHVGVRVEVIDWKQNRGKRDGMAECIRASKHDILVFIDSDSFVIPSTLKKLIKYFSDPRVSAVAGHAFVENASTNALTHMQAVRYYVAFKAYKAAEALFGAVTCCSGCCSAYRRTHLMEILDEWQNQMFLGVKCTYGDDRSLTNSLLEKDYITLFAPDALSTTIVPDTLKKYMKQQLRWKKSWTRECLRASLFIWKRNPIASISFYLSVILPLAAPIVMMRALVWYPYATSQFPWYYVTGLLTMSVAYGLYYYIHTQDRRWVMGVASSLFFSMFLVWQLPYAILQIRDSQWGTR